jgi:hypothetical protein
MTRIGINPARGKTTGLRPAQITLCVLTYLPDLSGYFEHRLEVLKLVFASLAANTALPSATADGGGTGPAYDLMVFDNGSCTQVVDYLREQHEAGQIDYLMLSSRNIGKIDALKVMFNAAPGEIIAYNDDDILFYPGWLPAHLEVLESFPKVGMVSGVAVRNAAGHACHSLEQLAEATPLPIQGGRWGAGTASLTARRERYIPDEWEVDWALSTGRDPQAHLQATCDQQDLVFRLETAGGQDICTAIGSANHFQFLSPKAVILQALPAGWTGRLMGSMIELDEAIDRLGYLRLSTGERFTRHMGNALSADVLEDARKMNLPGAGSSGEASASTPPLVGRGAEDRFRKRNVHWLLRIPGSRRLLSATYKRLFDILYR